MYTGMSVYRKKMTESLHKSYKYLTAFQLEFNIEK